MLATDEIDQSSAEFGSVCDNIIRLLCGINIYKGNKLEIGTYDPTQLQPINGHPFLVSPNLIPCYKIVQIKNSVRTQKRIKISFAYSKLQEQTVKKCQRNLSLLMSLLSYAIDLHLCSLGILL